MRKFYRNSFMSMQALVVNMMENIYIFVLFGRKCAPMRPQTDTSGLRRLKRENASTERKLHSFQPLIGWSHQMCAADCHCVLCVVCCGQT